MNQVVVFAVQAAVLASAVAAAPGASGPGAERAFERVFRAGGQMALDALTRTGAVAVRTGDDGVVTVRGTVRRNVSWQGAHVTNAQIEDLRSAPPVRLDAGTVRIERPADETLWRATSIDYEIVVPADARIRVVTASGSVSADGVGGGVSAETGSGAVRIAATAGAVAVRSGSGAVRVSGRMASLEMETQSGSISAEADEVGSLVTSSGSGAVRVTGVRGPARAETGSGRVELEGSPIGEWLVRSRSGSVSLRMPDDSAFDLVASSRSGDVKTSFAVAGAVPRSKHRVEGRVNGGGPRVSVETGSSQISIRP